MNEFLDKQRDHAFLLGHEVVPITFNEYLARIKENPELYKKDRKSRRVGDDEVNGRWVSTVFLALDHGFDGKPLWFETMVFSSRDDLNEIYLDRYETWEEAEQGHAKAVAWVKAGEPDLTDD